MRVTLCRWCDGTNIIRDSSTFSNQGVVMSVNRRMIETWYVYTALTKLVDGGLEVVDNDDKAVISLIDRDEFIHIDADNYELTTINIDLNDPTDAIAQTCPHLVTGFF